MSINTLERDAHCVRAPQCSALSARSKPADNHQNSSPGVYVMFFVALLHEDFSEQSSLA